MPFSPAISHASADAAPEVAALVGALLGEIMERSGNAAFNFDLVGTTARLAEWLEQGNYTVLTARDSNNAMIGFAALTESRALYAEGVFGTLTELYVRPEYRSHGLGKQLLDAACAHGASLGWKRLEVTTPPLPHFSNTLAFYEREGFSVAGGKKLKRVL